MSIGVLIKEGQIGRKVLPVEKLKINNIGSGESYWVPEENTEVDSLDVSENGLYYAVNDNLDGYDQVNVNVSPDMTTEDAEKGKKVAGKGDNGNDYAYGLDEDGNLTVEQIPAAIHIVVPPRKLKYEEGETLDFTGIHVYLMNGNNQRYTDEDYPTGEIPFDELIFPVTTAKASSGNEYKSKDGLIIALRYMMFDPIDNTYSQHFFADLTQPVPMDEEHQSRYDFAYFGSFSAYDLYVVRYGDYIYLASSSSSIGNLLVLYVNGDRVAASGRQIGQAHIGIGEFKQSIIDIGKEFSHVPISQADPVGYSLDDFSVIPVDIPVQWIRPEDGEVLEDVFTIEVGGGGEPVPSPPDPWGGYADVSYNGHHYNLNRRIVPEIHYANGYLWQEGTSEYTVDQAIDMGWLILIR